jgi:hypothetical protein
MNPILEALAVDCEPITLPTRDDEILKKILSDNLVTLRAQEIMVAHFALEAVRQMKPAERQALLKRIGCGPRPAHHRVTWAVEPGLQSGRPMIKGTCGRCGNSCHFTGTPAAATTTTWSHCLVGPSRIPEAFIEEYRGKYGFTA